MDTGHEAALVVHWKDGSLMKFIEHESRLYLFDGIQNKHTNKPVRDYSFVQTVSKNKKMFSQHELEEADQTRALYVKLGHYKHNFNNCLPTT